MRFTELPARFQFFGAAGKHNAAENETLARAATGVYLEESPCPLGLNILAAAGIQLVNTCIERLELRQRREATDRQEPLVTAV